MNQIERTLALAALCLAGVGAGVGAAQAPLVSVSVQPVQPLIEQGKQQQLLNFDFRVDNMSTDKIELSGIEVSVLGAGGTLLAQHRLGARTRDKVTARAARIARCVAAPWRMVGSRRAASARVRTCL